MRTRIDQLAGQFLQRCSQDMVSVHGAVARLRSGDAAALQELEHLTHRICGTGASLGFESLSACAGAAERLAEAQASSTVPDQQATERLVEHIARLEKEIDLLAKTH
jgi:HPt (histidine-containing phosphotransfer) domain-containing protein